ncbi:MAG TPA: zinc ribbon domain-containing protein, partial [Ktedonobacterales bacterium]
MNARMIRCLHCGRPSPPDVLYCPFCGEAIAPKLVAELQWLYSALIDLDTRISRGEGEHTITSLRDEYRERYLSARRAPTTQRSATAAAPKTEKPLAVSTSPAASSTSSTPPNLAAAMPATSIPAVPATPAQPRASQPPQPVFSWQAFLSEQAIAIMMYMGGFLGLVAMLSFEIGGWQALDLSIKLGAVILVYLAFGIVGLVLRRLPRLRTVGGAYLGVFALMTPLLALGVYRFGLQAAGFSGAAMLCLSSMYAAVIYLALAWRTSFATYAYLGWVAMILALLTIVFWVNAPRESLILALALAALILLVPGIFHRFSLAALLETSALQLAAVTSILAAGGTLFLGLALWSKSLQSPTLVVSPAQLPQPSTAVYALAAGVLVPVAVGWSYLARHLSGSLDDETRAERLNVVDWLIVAAATQAAIAVASWLGADRHAMAIVLAMLALAEMALLFILWQRVRERVELRYLVEALALTLAVGGCLGVFRDSPPNWPYLLALTAGVAVTVGLAIFESAPLWLLAGGVFLSLDYHTLLDALFQPASTFATSGQEATFWSIATTLLVVALTVPWLVAPPTSRIQRFAPPVYVIALANALYVTRDLLSHDAFLATLILGLNVLLALLAGWRSRHPVAGGLVAGFFGFFLPLPLSVARGESDLVAGAALAAVVVALAALGIRALLGRAAALPAYLIALWVSLVVSWRVLVAPGNLAGVRFLDISSSAWLLLSLAVLATIAILWDNLPWALFIPALYGMIAALITAGLWGVALTVALASTGALLRRVRGRWYWSMPWHVAALLASLAQLNVFIVLGLRGAIPQDQPLYVALLFALMAYLVAGVGRQPWLTSVVPVYIFIAAASARDPYSFLKILAITFGVIVVGVILRLRFSRRWALACYLSAIGPSLAALAHATPNTHGVAEALLLTFAVTAYGVVLIERAPVAGLVPVAYVGLAASVQPDAHALLPLSLLLAAAGIGIGRIAGWRWSWPAYTGALIAAATMAVAGIHQPAFEGWALLTLAVAAYLVALIESQAEVVALAMLLGALALAAGANALDLPTWQMLLLFVALSWVYYAAQWIWGVLSWLPSRPGHPWWLGSDAPPAVRLRWQDRRFVGRLVHRGAGLLLGSGVVVAALMMSDTYATHTALAQVEVVALLSLSVMVALSARVIPLHALWYVSGGLLAVAVSWELRWLGADNIQAFVLAPGSYLLIIGALLPADNHLRNPARLGQLASLFGALLLLLPTLTQSFTTTLSENWIYATVLALEALVIAAIGVGTHARALILLGTGFFGLAAIRG